MIRRVLDNCRASWITTMLAQERLNYWGQTRNIKQNLMTSLRSRFIQIITWITLNLTVTYSNFVYIKKDSNNYMPIIQYIFLVTSYLKSLHTEILLSIEYHQIIVSWLLSINLYIDWFIYLIYLHNIGLN